MGGVKYPEAKEEKAKTKFVHRNELCSNLREKIEMETGSCKTSVVTFLRRNLDLHKGCDQTNVPESNVKPATCIPHSLFFAKN
jgi:hypothetical protein